MSASSRRSQPWIKRVAVVIAVLVVASIVGVFAISPDPSETEPGAVVAGDEASARRSVDAYAGRLTGMADRYLAKTGMSQRAVDAYAARQSGMAEQYLGKIGMSQRAIDAYAARYTGTAEHYLATGK